MVVRQLERITRSKLIDELVVATSTEVTDDALAATLKGYGYAVRRGPLNDVLTRFLRVVDEFTPDVVVRLTADCPLADPSVIDDLIAHHLSSGADYSSNVLTRTYPHGLDAECMKSDALSRLSTLELNSAEREHVTLGIYTRPTDFTLSSLTQARDLSRLRWTVDYPEDLAFVRSIYDALYDDDPSFTQEDVLRHLAKHPELVRTVSDI
jgi:spore coat polysaccharide biosynthesis protein SpsF